MHRSIQAQVLPWKDYQCWQSSGKQKVSSNAILFEIIDHLEALRTKPLWWALLQQDTQWLKMNLIMYKTKILMFSHSIWWSEGNHQLLPIKLGWFFVEENSGVWASWKSSSALNRLISPVDHLYDKQFLSHLVSPRCSSGLPSTRYSGRARQWYDVTYKAEEFQGKADWFSEINVLPEAQCLQVFCF